MSDTAAFHRYCQRLAAGLRAAGHRRLLLLPGDESWGRKMAAAVMVDGQGLLLSPQPLAGHSPASKPESLGIESDWLVINGHHYCSVNRWLAAAGTLRAGGLLILLCPPFSDWSRRYAASMREQGFDVDDSRFIRRVLAECLHDHACTVVAEGQPIPELLPMPQSRWQAALPSADQLHTVQAICRVATGRAGRPLVIRADRGRGKTAALGLAAAQLLRDGQHRVVITAARPEMVETAFRHAQEALPAARREKQTLQWQAGCLQYLSPSALLDETCSADVLLVDEAAHLSLPLLDRLLQRYSRVVFASTVHGYEGSGRGFDIRFRRRLDRHRPHWRRAALHSPLRWAADDPLEASLNRVFLLGAEEDHSAAEGRLQLQTICAQRLTDAGSSVLSAVHHLLLAAHYQTTPQDLQFLLDLPGQIVLAWRGAALVGVCQALYEGEFAPSLAAAVCCGERRPKGHLLAQSLAQYTGETSFLQARSLRVNRIAVVDSERRRGIASALLNALAESASSEGIGFLSASFACEAEVLTFWRAAGFRPLYLGSRRDAASGSYSLMVMRALQHDWQGRADIWQQRFARSLLDSVCLLQKDLPTEALTALLSVLPTLSDDEDRRQVLRYARKQLSFEMAAANLKRFCVGRPTPGLLVARLYAERDWGALAKAYRLGGRSAIEAAMRSALVDICKL